MLHTAMLVLLLSLLNHASAQRLSIYGIIGNYLAEIDPETGMAEPVAALAGGFTDLAGLTYDPSSDDLYVVANARTNPLLVQIDRLSGQMTSIGSIDQLSPAINFRLIEAMAYNPADGKLYAAGYELNVQDGWYFSRRLMQVSTLTGKATVVSTITGTCQDEADALAFAFTSATKYSLDVCQSTNAVTGLYALDLATGVSTLIGYNDLPGGATLAVHPTTGKLFAVAPSDRKLYCVNPANGEVSLLNTTHTSDKFAGATLTEIVFVPARNQPPVATCSPLTVEAGQHCQAVVLPAAFDGGSSDENQDALSFSVDVAAPYTLGITNVILTVSDGQLTDQCSTTIQVVDTTPPVSRCHSPQIVLNDAGQATISVADIDFNASDACGIKTLTLSRTTFSCADIRPTVRRRPSVVPVTLVVTDDNGNSSSCTARVEIMDQTPPRALCRSISVALPREGRYNLLPTEVDNGSWDACGLALSLSQSTFSCADLGVNTITLTARDQSGNSSSCQATVTISQGNAICTGATGSLVADRVTDKSPTPSLTAELRLYPNPAVDELTISFPPASQPTQLAIYDQLGRTLWQQLLQPGQAMLNLSLDPARFPAGLYFVHRQGGGTPQAVQRLIVR